MSASDIKPAIQNMVPKTSYFKDHINPYLSILMELGNEREKPVEKHPVQFEID